MRISDWSSDVCSSDLRTPRVTITDNSFDDSGGRLTNYMIDLSNGASGTISGNEMVQGRDKDNYSALITVAPEGREQDRTRSEERRGGKESVSPFRVRRSQEHSKTKQTKNKRYT